MSRNRRRAVAMAIAGAFAVAPLVSACGAGQHPQSVLPTRLTEGVNASVGHVDVRNAFVLGPDPGQRLPQGANAPFYAYIVDKAGSDRLVGVDAPGVAQSVQIAGGGIDLPSNQLISLNPQSGSRPAGVPTPGTSPSGTPTPATSPGATATPGASGSPGKAGKKAKPGKSGTATPQSTPSSPAASASSPAGTTGAATPLVILSGLTAPLNGGENIRLTLHFQQAGSLTVTVPVIPRADYYSTYPPAPSGTIATTPTPGAPGSPTTPGASPTPGASTSPTAGAATPTKHAKAKKASAKPTS
ncbi:RAD23 family protein [Actinoallomurus rhizosphaericola]|uniref:hypothetical protein n=1 Tax=Actinoallomurus rhizosphaericola TaxID=2952536 RepID=UPI00209009DD|nr:hypothetical protein [Actinoallomurus rhizosphaericola]MCO5993210.1 hypothetical protein [Actinoallomurus rhizosphaericola]